MNIPTQESNLTDWLDYLLAIHPTEIDMGLTRVTQVAKQLNVLDLQPAQIITVAGTNGKGTSCAMLESILIESGKTVGVYSSPHLVHYNERVRINQQDCLDEQFIAAFSAIEAARGEISLTFFEYATLAALYLFKLAKLDVILLEVGLGGRLDATNMVDSTATIITSIDLDHQEYLGDTRELVGREKAGVCRTGCISVIGEPNLPQSVIDYAEQIQCQLVRVGDDFNYQLQQDSWLFQSDLVSFNGLSLPRLPLANAASVVALVTKLWPQITQDMVNNGLQKAYLPGRLEQLMSAPDVLVDVAHNPHAARYLAEQLQRLPSKNGQQRRIIAICGMLKDKDISSVLATLATVISQWNMVTLHNDRGATSTYLAQKLNGTIDIQLAQGIEHKPLNLVQEFDSMSLAWDAVRKTINADDVVIVFGSFYTVAAFKSLM
ncbi:bifunctional tetrahydrofolate synthase/dihydrofolate synthase [Shewanella gaetbuli]|uniref:Dihydrofolate synthase/folylpolyglutamate synthase n=1 Tax=Shewanella gaetbuli TaxID=220752 RepID=A0A9X1ZQF0_9GAMM|nr:bifunctional tetrahydrofolate synthase/dihydrofolate synthase [Shewanella gaetbuli]MCL1143665.1 bifunctional tetrahydrofolate synthase/dihydrofolate synthase [Shewanella gaetbuli]